MNAQLQEQILQLSIPEPNSGCWLWVGSASCAPVQLRPFLYLNGRRHAVNRLSLAAFKGPIPEGLCACHTCHNPMCVNPDHLYAGTKKQNTQDMMRAGRHAANNPIHRERLVARILAVGAKRRAQTHCKRGHPLSGDNLFVSKKGFRTCRTCWRALQRSYYYRDREQTNVI